MRSGTLAKTQGLDGHRQAAHGTLFGSQRQIYGIYLRYAAPEHIHVYSIDEVFIDATPYLRSLGMGPHAMARTIVREILAETGITATAGIGTNMYLAKVAMDIVAKTYAGRRGRRACGRTE